MEFIIGLLWIPEFPFFTFFAPVFALAFWWIGGLWERDERKIVVLWLKHDRTLTLYQILISGALNSISSILGQRELATRRNRTKFPKNLVLISNKMPWSWGLLELSVLYAFAYPVFCILIQWILFGRSTMEKLNFFYNAPILDRLPVIIIAILSVTLFSISLYLKRDRHSLALFYISFALAIWFVLILSLESSLGSTSAVIAITLSVLITFATSQDSRVAIVSAYTISAVMGYSSVLGFTGGIMAIASLVGYWCLRKAGASLAKVDGPFFDLDRNVDRDANGACGFYVAD